MKINYGLIQHKAKCDFKSLTEMEAAVWNWVQCFKDGTVDYNHKLETDECFKDHVEEVLIWRLRFERDHYESALAKNIQRLMHHRQKYNNFIDVCHDILGKE